MEKHHLAILFTILFAVLSSCTNKTDKDIAINLVKSQYNSGEQKLNFENTSLDSLYNITPKAYADSIKRGNELDSVLAVLETQIEHYEQRESDSVGLISTKLTKERYRLLEVAKTKPQFVGWKLTGVRTNKVKSEILSFKFNKAITQVVD